MKNILTIFMRELRAYYTSAIGYIFMIVFLLVSMGLFITSFFTFPQADMRQFFSVVPLVLCVFIPAVTMRLWAEDRKENTFEMLLTFPMKTYELVIGKFLSSFCFFLITLFATFTIPIMLLALGDPDMGAIFSGYLGTALLGAFFLSIGIFVSGLCKDQIVAFMITLLVCFALFLIGTTFIAAYLDGVIPGMGSFLEEMIGVTGHFNAFAKGVVEVGDLLFFVVWIGIALMLNCIFMEGRNRARAKMIFATAVALSVLIGMVFNFIISSRSLGRFDMTEDKIFTVSEGTKRILSDLKVPVQIKVYITPKEKMPTEMKDLEQDVLDKLEEMRIASSGNIQYRAVHMEAANVLPGSEEDKEEGKLEKRLLDKGVKPFSVRALRGDEVQTRLVYSSVGIAYKDKEEEIIPQIVPQNLMELEYRLVNTIFKMVQTKQSTIALMAPVRAFEIPPHIEQYYRQMGQPIPQTEDPYQLLQQVLAYEKYDVRRVEISREEQLPEDFDTLVVINPRRLNERQKWEINRALVEGKSVFMAVQMNKWDYQVQRNRISISRVSEEPGINDLLETYGVTVDEDILMDQNHDAITIADSSDPFSQMFGMGQTLKLPFHIVVYGNSMNQDVSITSRLDRLFYMWGSALKIDDDTLKENHLGKTILMSTSEDAWTIEPSRQLSESDFMPVSGETRQFPLAAMVSGQFPDVYKNEERPAWPQPEQRPGEPPPPPPEEEEPPKLLKPGPGKLVLVGCAMMFNKDFLSQAGVDLFINTVDALTLGEDLINVRSKKPRSRAIDKPNPATRTFWKFVNLGLVNIIIAFTGIFGAMVRRKSREAYTAAQERSMIGG